MNQNIAWVDRVEGTFEFTETWAKFTELAGLVIKEVHVDSEAAIIHFVDDGGYVRIADEGQSCCESRYMACDDDYTGLAGGSLVCIELDAAAPPSKDVAETTPDPDEDDWGSDSCHETEFVKVTTTKGSFTLCTHNEHNGYYGGFSINVKLVR
jgi:hypothetical protein